MKLFRIFVAELLLRLIIKIVPSNTREGIEINSFILDYSLRRIKEKQEQENE